MTSPARTRRYVFPLVFLAAAAYALFIRFHSPAFLTFYEDDAFYYFQIARNVVTGHGSSFDGSHLTNGYHPLWMLVVVGVMLVAHGKAFFVALQAVIFVCFAASFFLLRKLFGGSATGDVCAGVIGLGCLLLLRGGMEITLTLPLSLLLIEYRLRPSFRWSLKQAVVYGLLASLVILSRLDAVVLVILLFGPDLLRGRRSTKLLAVAVCVLPLALYALSNHHYFHTWTTVSSQAKQLRPHHSIFLSQIAASLEPINAPYRILVLAPAALLAVLAAIALVRRRSSVVRWTPTGSGNDVCVLALILFPALQFLAFFLLSDWLVWPWYIYSVPLAATGFVLYLLRGESSPVAMALTPLLQAGLLVVTALYAAACAADRVHSRWYVFAEDLTPFTQAHPGIYAMGDCAGTPAWVTEKPFVQLEGLAMDENFLDNIRQQRNLNEVLRSYHVRYYVTQDAVLGADGCYAAEEPYQGGPDSPRMHGIFCRQPVASFQHGSGPRSTLRVFDAQ